MRYDPHAFTAQQSQVWRVTLFLERAFTGSPVTHPVQVTPSAQVPYSCGRSRRAPAHVASAPGADVSTAQMIALLMRCR